MTHPKPTPNQPADILAHFADHANAILDGFCRTTFEFTLALSPTRMPAPRLPEDRPPGYPRLHTDYNRQNLEDLAHVIRRVRQHLHDTGSLPLLTDITRHFEDQNAAHLADLARLSPYPNLLCCIEKPDYTYRPKRKPSVPVYQLAPPERLRGQPTGAVWNDLQDAFTAFTNDTPDGYVPIDAFITCFSAYYPDFNQELPPQAATLERFFQIFCGTFDTDSRPGHVKAHHSFTNPDPALFYINRDIPGDPDRLAQLAALLSLPGRKKPPLQLSPDDLYRLMCRKRHYVPGVYGADDIAQLLDHYRESGFYQLDRRGRLENWGPPRHHKRIDTIHRIIDVLADDKGHAPLAHTAYLAAQLYPPFNWTWSTPGLLTYTANLATQPFTITDDGFIATTHSQKHPLYVNHRLRHLQRRRLLEAAGLRRYLLDHPPSATAVRVTRLVQTGDRLTRSLGTTLATAFSHPLDRLVDTLSPVPKELTTSPKRPPTRRRPKNKPESQKQPCLRTQIPTPSLSWEPARLRPQKHFDPQAWRTCLAITSAMQANPVNGIHSYGYLNTTLDFLTNKDNLLPLPLPHELNAETFIRAHPDIFRLRQFKDRTSITVTPYFRCRYTVWDTLGYVILAAADDTGYADCNRVKDLLRPFCPKIEVRLPIETRTLNTYLAFE